jgi:raffinose/stachyose/melibiose transport system substrate-binding protein
MGVLADAGLITPLQPFAEEFGWDERIAQSARNGASYEGELYGLPLQVDLIGVYVNTTLMTEAGLETPTTFEEILTFCQSATEAGYLPFAFANQEGWEAFHQIAMTGNNMIGPEAMGRLLLENEGRWDSPEMVGRSRRSSSTCATPVATARTPTASTTTTATPSSSAARRCCTPRATG